MATEADTSREYVLPKLCAAGWTDDQIFERRPVIVYLNGLAGQVAALARPRLHRDKLQSETAAELDALLPSILDKAFKGEL